MQEEFTLTWYMYTVNTKSIFCAKWSLFSYPISYYIEHMGWSTFTSKLAPEGSNFRATQLNMTGVHC